MLQCPRCGIPARSGARFCANCGTPVVNASSVGAKDLQLSQTRDVVRIMSLGEILTGSVRLFFRYFLRLFLASLIGYAIWALITIVLFVAVVIPVHMLAVTTENAVDDVVVVALGVLILSVPVALINAPLTLAVSSIVLTGRYSFGNLVANMFSRHLINLLLTVALQGILVFIGSLLIIPGIYLAIAFSMSPATVMLEDRAGLGALRRSRDLVRGYWWKTFGLMLMAFLIPVFGFVLLATAVTYFATGVSIAPYVLVGLLLLCTVAFPCFAAVVQVLLYYDLRSRRGNFSAKTLLTIPTLRPIYERI